MFDPADPKTWQARLTTAEVCAIARLRLTTLWRRIKAGTMPAAIDAGRQSMFDRDAVRKALGVLPDGQDGAPDREFDPDALREVRARQLRERKEARQAQRRAGKRAASQAK